MNLEIAATARRAGFVIVMDAVRRDGTEPLTLPGPQAELVDVIVDNARANAPRILIS